MIMDVHRAASVRSAIRRSIMHSIGIIGMTTGFVVSVVGIGMIAGSRNRNRDRYWLRDTCMMYSLLMAVRRWEH